VWSSPTGSSWRSSPRSRCSPPPAASPRSSPTVIYPSSQAADGVRLARLLGQDKALSDLVENEIPRQIVLKAPVVTKANVDKYIDSAFES
jgi:hypothetical protein